MEKHKKILIFGVGKKYSDLKEYINYNNVIGFLDNKIEKEAMLFEGKPIYNPARIPNKLDYDGILLMSMYYFPMKCQLIKLGIQPQKIYSIFQIGQLEATIISDQEICVINKWKKSERRFLLIQHDGGGGGATIALTNLAMALSKKYSVLVTFPTKGETVAFYNENNISYICNIQMNCDTEIFRSIISKADKILVNAIIDNNVIELLHRENKRFYLWLHDHSTTYDRSDCKLLKECIDQNVKILAVSQKAADVFSFYIKKSSYILFPLAINSNRHERQDKKISREPTFAVIGDICSIKGQDILIKALDRIKNKFKLKLIGGIGTESEYSNQIIARCKETDYYEYLGKMTNKEVHKLFLENEIDILICPSRFETLSIATIEAMSYGIPVIVSDGTGIADYINEVEPNCIFRSEDSISLALKIEWILSSEENMRAVGEKMKCLYNEHFSIKQLEKECSIFDHE